MIFLPHDTWAENDNSQSHSVEQPQSDRYWLFCLFSLDAYKNQNKNTFVEEPSLARSHSATNSTRNSF